MSSARWTLVELYKCEECEHVSDEYGSKLYECGECGNKQVDERRCESCNKFMAKLAERSCVECEEGEVTVVYGLECACHGDFHEIDAG